MSDQEWERPENIDAHPMRYSPTRIGIENIILRRLYEKRLDGYTLETSLEIIDYITKVLK